MMRPDPSRLLPKEPHGIEKLWYSLGLGFRLALIGALILLIGYGALRALRYFSRKSGRSFGRTLLFWLTGWMLVLAAGLGFWTKLLPPQRGSGFILWHQFVRAGTVLSGMGATVGLLALLVPWLLDRVEARGFTSFVAARHVRAHKSGFLTVISVLSIAGVGLSSFALCGVVSVMGGFGMDLKRKILGNYAHVRIEAERPGGFDHWRSVLDEVRLVSGVHAATPVAGGEAMASSASNTAGVNLRGVDTVTIGTVIDLPQNIEIGKLKYLDDPAALARLPADEPIGIGAGGELYLKGPNPKALAGSSLDPDVAEALEPADVYPGIVIGKELAKSLHVYVGDELTLVSPLGDLGPMGILPKSRRFRVAAIFYSGMYEYDASHAYVTLDVAQEFFDIDKRITAIEIKVAEAERVDEVRPRIEALAAGDELRVRDWKELNKNLFSALKLEKIATFIILSLAILVASFCIICTLLLMVTEKSKEISILKALGATDRSVLRVFMLEGVIIGGVGTVFGVAAGAAMALGLLWFGLGLDPEVYYVNRLPVHVDLTDFALVALSSLLITTLSTIYPAVAASRLRPVDGIRYE